LRTLRRDGLRSPTAALCALAFLLGAAPAFAQEKLTLEEAVKRAVTRNSNALFAQQEIVRAEGILGEARAPSLPTLTANGTILRLDSDRKSGNQVFSPMHQQTANITLLVPLIAPQRWVAWAHASDQVEIARTAAADVQRGVAVTTARAYLGVMAQHRLVQIDTQARDDAKAHLDDAHARFEVGSGNRLDEVRAGQELATDEANLAAAYSALARSMEALGVLVGEEGPVDVTEQIELPKLPAPDEALRDAEALRTDVRISKERTEVARKVLRDSYADYLPILSAVVQPFYQHPALFTTPDTGWQAQLLLSIPLYDGGARYGLHKERSAAYEEAKVQAAGLMLEVRSELRTAFEEVKRADESLSAARQAAKLAHDALEMTMLAYREGATNDLEVVDAERRSRDADTAALGAEDTARQARIDLLAASGRFP
jgi:outer membrane protein TolC